MSSFAKLRIAHDPRDGRSVAELGIGHDSRVRHCACVCSPCARAASPGYCQEDEQGQRDGRFGTLHICVWISEITLRMRYRCRETRGALSLVFLAFSTLNKGK